MNQPRLMTMSGARLVTLDEIRDLPQPCAIGPRHFPIPHGAFINNVLNGLDRFGAVADLARAQWALKDTRAHLGGDKITVAAGQMFGVVPIRLDAALARDEGWEFVMGLRASTDQSFAANLVAGDHVMVCDNLSFSGEVQMTRKNTRFWHKDLAGRIERMLGGWRKLAGKIKDEIEWMKGFRLGANDTDSLILDLLRREVIGVNRLGRVMEEMEKPSHREFGEHNVWSFRNNVTECLKDLSPDALIQRTQRLQRMLALRFARPAMVEVLSE